MDDLNDIVVLSPAEALRVGVSKLDASLANLASPDEDKRMDAILDAAELLIAAKRVVLDS